MLKKPKRPQKTAIDGVAGRRQKRTNSKGSLINIDEFYGIGGVPGSSAGVLFKCMAATAKKREANEKQTCVHNKQFVGLNYGHACTLKNYLYLNLIHFI